MVPDIAAHMLAWTLLLTVSEAMDIYTDPVCSRATDPDITLGSIRGPDVTMVAVFQSVLSSTDCIQCVLLSLCCKLRLLLMFLATQN